MRRRLTSRGSTVAPLASPAESEISLVGERGRIPGLRGALAMLTGLILILSHGYFVSPAQAHHGWSSYDQSQTISLTGLVQRSGYEHPHGFVVLQAEGKIFTVVLAPPFRMENRGLPREAIQPGREVTVQGYALRSDPSEIRAERITAAGKTIELR
jgi:hypothetical protein